MKPRVSCKGLAIFSIPPCLMLFGFVLSRYRSTAPEWRVDSTSQRIIAPQDGKPIVAQYKVTNVGGMDLRLEKSTTSCGCTLASIEPSVLKPGESGKITVEGKPPSAGERPVQVVVTTNAPRRKEIDLELIMVGVKPPPLIFHSPNHLEFGLISPNDRRQTLAISTLEKVGAKPWLDKASSKSPVLAIKGGMVNEMSVGNETMNREYRFEVEVVGELKPGQFSAQLEWASQKSDASPILTIPATWRVHPPVYLTPSVLYASLVEGEEPPQLRVNIHGTQNGQPIDVKPAGNDHDAFVTVKVLDRQKDRVTFAVIPKLPLKSSIDTKIVFQTNHAEASSVTLPVHIQLSSYDKSTDSR